VGKLFYYRLMSKSGSDHFSDLEEEVSSPEQREVSPPEGGLSDVSIPEVIQSPDPEEFLPEENLLGDFERAYLDRPLNRRSPELKRTRSPSVRRGQPVNEPRFPTSCQIKNCNSFPEPRWI
jgi:hypothetical protein